MDSDTVAFGSPVVILFVGSSILVFGLAQGGLNAIAMVGGLLALVSVGLLTKAVAAFE